jgi:hypothetical protein
MLPEAERSFTPAYFWRATMSPAQKAKAVKHAAKKAAKARRRTVKKAKAPRSPGADFTVTEWCAKRRVTKPFFYKLLKLGLAPKTMKLRKRRTISPQADAEWQAEREAATLQEEAAA